MFQQKPLNKVAAKTLLKVLYVASLLVVLVEFLTYHDSILNNTGLSAKLVILALFGLHAALFFATKREHRFSQEFSFGNLFILLPTSILLTVIVLLLEEGRLFLNYFLEIYKINFEAILLLSFPGLLFGLLHLPPSFLKNNWQTLFATGTLLSIVTFGLYYLMHPFEYSDLIVEDGLVEMATALLFFVSGLISFNLSRKKLFANKYHQLVYKLGCIAVGVALTLVALEEISWGQRIFNIETPDHIADQNHQDEINIHNSETFW
ncbi:hypothetical protein KC721_03545, partial [Candidatus Woesebacteria bacterium]|nr:hypothetical protein [Candidatus Woesebacteria bacterium]